MDEYCKARNELWQKLKAATDENKQAAEKYNIKRLERQHQQQQVLFQQQMFQQAFHAQQNAAAAAAFALHDQKQHDAFATYHHPQISIMNCPIRTTEGAVAGTVAPTLKDK